jgi:hypothetical protein
VAFLGIGAPAAFGAQAHVSDGTLDTSAIPDGTCCFSGIAVDQSGGDLYLTDQFAPPSYGFGAIHRFDNAGAYDTTFTAEELLSGPQDVAIDNSGTGSDGTVYIADSGHNQVVALDESGNPVASFGTNGRIDGAASEPGSEDALPSPFTGFANPDGLAVDPATGNLFVADQFNNRVWIFDSTGKRIGQVADSTLVVPGGLAFDSTGENLYVRTGLSCYCDPREASVLRFHRDFPTDFSFSQVVSASNFQTGENFANDVAVDTSTNHVYVDLGDRIREYDEAGTEVATFGQGVFCCSTSLAVDSESGKLYVAEGATVYVFAPLTTTPPLATIDSVDSGGVTATSAHLTGSVDPQGADTNWRFEVSTDHSNWTVVNEQGPLTGTGAQTVEDDATGLQPNKEYFTRLVADNGFDEPTVTSEEAFKTDAAAPTASTGAALATGSFEVRKLTGAVNPNNLPTTYWFEYGEEDCSTSACASVPATQDADAGSGGAPVAVARFVNALEPSTTYHYRLVAENSVGTTMGADQTFTTPATAGGGEGEGLPDNRGYEMVSDPNKHGADVLRTRVRAAVDGSATGYGQFIASGDVVGTGLATDFVSKRTGQPGTRGWATHAISPPQPALSIAKVLLSYDTAYQRFFSEDLSRGIVRAPGPLTGDPDVAQAVNLYLRDNLLEPGPGDYQLITQCPACAGTPIPATSAVGRVPEFIEATPDFGQILFESKLVLENGALLNKSNLYEWDHGTVKLAGILPDGTPAKGSVAGGFRSFGNGSLFYAPHLPEHSISDDGSKVFFTDLTTKNAYMRVDGAQTVLLSTSEKTNGSGPGGTDPGGPLPAQFFDASQSGSRVFFTSKEALTDDAPADGDRHLYMYDTTKPDSDPHNLTYLNVDDPASPESANNVDGVIGADAAGRTIYFIDNGQLVAGEPSLGSLGVGRGVFAWHDGVVSFVSPLNGADIAEMSRDQTTGLQTQVAANGDLLLSLHLPVGPTGYDQGHCPGGFEFCRELYLYRIATHALSCASCNPSGAPATVDAVIVVGTGVGALTYAGEPDPDAITTDGSRAFFTTAEALVPADRNGVNDVYEYDAASGRARLVSSGTDPAPSYFMDATPSGNDVFFVTRERLVGWDVDQNYDLYDARVGGGFPEPVALHECSGDACQGPSGPTPATPAAGSGVEGNGNLHQRRCARNQRKVRRHGKAICVKKHRKRDAKHNRRAGR